MEDERGFWDLLYLPLSVIGPILVTLLYLLLMVVQGEAHFAPGQGAGAARRDLLEFVLYGAALLASLTLMFFAFFARMAP